MKKTIRLTERDLARLVKRVISEQKNNTENIIKVVNALGVKEGIRICGLDIVKEIFQDEEITFDLVESIIDSFNWDEETLHNLVSDIFIEEPYMMEDIHDREDYILEIVDWIIDGKYNPVDWIYEMNDTYGEGND